MIEILRKLFEANPEKSTMVLNGSRSLPLTLKIEHQNLLRFQLLNRFFKTCAIRY